MNISRYFLKDHKSLSTWIAYQQDKYTSFIMTLLHPRKNETILDDGSGNGRFSIAMANRGARVVCLDINKMILETAAEAIGKRKLGDKTEFVVGDIQNLPFKGKVFDKVLCVHNLWYVPDYRMAVSEMLRTLKNEGAVITDHLNLLNLHFCIGGLFYIVKRILRQSPEPIFYRTPRQVIHPFRACQTEIFGLWLESTPTGPSRFVYARTSPRVLAPRLIVRSSKPLRQIP